MPPIGRDAPPTSADRDAAFSVLDRLSGLAMFEADIAAAYSTIWGGVIEEKQVERLAETSANDLFDEWIWFDHQLHTGGTLAEYALAHHQAELGAGGRRFLLACSEAPLRLLQVDRVEEKTWVLVRDLIDGGTVTVSDYAGSEQLFPDDVLAARIARYGVSAQFEGMSLSFDAQHAAWIVDQVRRLRAPLEQELADGADRQRKIRMATGAAILQSAISLFEHDEPLILTDEGVLEFGLEGNDWLDTPVPELGLRTPREAAAVPHLRETLLSLMESIEAAQRAKGRAGFDAARLRSALGLK